MYYLWDYKGNVLIEIVFKYKFKHIFLALSICHTKSCSSKYIIAKGS